MSSWYRKVSDAEMGPLAFAELVALVRAGKLGDDDLVRRAEQSNWQRAREVVGLFRAARLPMHLREPNTGAAEEIAGARGECHSPDDRPASSAHEAASEGHTSRAADSRELGTRAIALTCAGLVLLLALAGAGWYWHQQATRFPAPPDARAGSVGTLLPRLGPFSLIELVLLCIDVCVVTGMLLYFGIRVRKMKRSG